MEQTYECPNCGQEAPALDRGREWVIVDCDCIETWPDSEPNDVCRCGRPECGAC